MADSSNKEKKSAITLDWLVGGALTRIGETVDRVTGRGWNPSSSLATSRLSEKLCFLLDEEVRKGEFGGKFAPHLITLKMQWDKFSSDAEEELLKLRDELHAAAIDHINDKRYHTFAPIEIEIKTDYFTEGVRIIGSFGQYVKDEEEAAVNVTLPNITIENIGDGNRVSIALSEENEVEIAPAKIGWMRFQINGKPHVMKIDFTDAKRLTIGRGKECGISIDHQSVSKAHASLLLNGDGKLLVSDTGSTNGTYVSGRRIDYGKVAEVIVGEKIKFGAVEVEIEMPMPSDEDKVLEDRNVSGTSSQDADSKSDAPVTSGEILGESADPNSGKIEDEVVKVTDVDDSMAEHPEKT